LAKTIDDKSGVMEIEHPESRFASPDGTDRKVEDKDMAA
jgi:hypothetical protein